MQENEERAAAFNAESTNSKDFTEPEKLISHSSLYLNFQSNFHLLV